MFSHVYKLDCHLSAEKLQCLSNTLSYNLNSLLNPGPETTYHLGWHASSPTLLPILLTPH